MRMTARDVLMKILHSMTIRNMHTKIALLYSLQLRSPLLPHHPP